MAINYDSLERFGFVDPNMDRVYHALCLAVRAGGDIGATLRPDRLPLCNTIASFRIMAGLIALRIEIELRRPIILGVFPDKCVFQYQEYA